MTDSTYRDDDFVYVDPRAKTVLGKVQWLKEGIAQPVTLPEQEGIKDERPRPGKDDRRGHKKPLKASPWGSYRSLKHAFRLEGKEPETEGRYTAQEAIDKFVVDPFFS